jgi:hypothetical protein
VTRTRRFTDADMPQLFLAADKTSLDAQAAFIGGTRLRLLLVVLSAASAITAWRVGASGVDVLALVSTLLFVGALMVEGVLWRDRPDKTWYDARAVAESAKTLAWKFAVRGEPFLDEGLSEAEISRRFVERLNEVRLQFRRLDLAAVDAQSVSTWMRNQRRASWDDRKTVYLVERLRQQKKWYADKAEYNKRRSTQWRTALVALEFLGVVASLVAAFQVWLPLLTPVLAAMVGAAVAWMETKQHNFNSRAYAAAVADLAQAEARLEVAESEQEWAMEVSNAEEAISREHTLWLASRTES